MKKQTITIIVTAVITVVALLVALIYFGPRYLMSLMTLAPGASAGVGGKTTSVPANLDTSTTMLTDQGLFRVSYASNETPLPLNQIHSWTLHVETADGQPVENAEIAMDGGMPQHGHGLPTSPQVTEKLGGDYIVEGMKFQMLGWWEVRFHIIGTDGQSDTVTFNLILE